MTFLPGLSERRPFYNQTKAPIYNTPGRQMGLHGGNGKEGKVSCYKHGGTVHSGPVYLGLCSNLSLHLKF